ncbi:hypothetical protein ACSBR2_011901 [Camellia fascicularis]
MLTTDSFASAQPLRHVDESSALLQFKQTFSMDEFASRDPFAYPKAFKTLAITCCKGNYQFHHCPPSFIISDNRLTREIPPLICRLSSLYRLDLLSNNLTGSILPCLSNLSDCLSILNLKEYEKILNIFTAIDFSSNKFKGEIPESIGKLKRLQLLKLSNNDLSGEISSCLGNPIKLESLDFSQNMLSGEIPQNLAFLTFLGFLNVSNNHLIGPFHKGKNSIHLRTIPMRGSRIMQISFVKEMCKGRGTTTIATIKLKAR